MLKISNLNLTLGGKRIFDNMSLNVERGEIYAVLGRNGTGKSTMAGVILGLITPESGDIYFEGERINDLSISDRAKRGIILGWQKNITIQGLTTKEYIRISSRNGITDGEIESCLEAVGLCARDYFDRILDSKLSGGERKRIELASVLAAHPKLAILDEPDSGIDAVSLAMIMEVIRRIASDGAVLLITHQEDIIHISTRAGLLCGAKIIREGTPEEAIHYFKDHCDVCDTVNFPPYERSATAQ